MIDKKEEFVAIKEAINDVELKRSGAATQQLRALWTAFAIHQDLEVDTAEYDSFLRELWQYITDADDNLHEAYVGKGFEAFDNFMCEFLV